MTTAGSVAPYAAQFVRFPPRWQNVLVPSGPPAATALGMTLYTASRPKPLLAQRVLWLLATTTGARFIPGQRESWSPPMEEDVFATLWDEWCRLAGGRVDGIAIYNRLQEFRAGLVLLLCAGRRSMLIRVRRDLDSMSLERRISAAAAVQPPASFRVPALMGAGQASGWHWVGYEVMSHRPHTPARRLGRGLTEDVNALVESVLPRPAEVPRHWRGSHGDLAPWNLRHAGRKTWLIDWEDAVWAPPGCDEVYFAATASAMRQEPTGPIEFPENYAEAQRFWADRIRQRVIADKEAQLQHRLSVLLGVDGRATDHVRRWR